MTEVRPLNAARVALIRDRLAALLVEQRGAFKGYDTGLQRVTPRTWWDRRTRSVTNPLMLVAVAKHWPSQPLAARLATFYEISIAALGIAERPLFRSRWAGQAPESLAFVEDTAKRTGRSVEVLQRMGKAFDDRKHRQAEALIQDALAKVRAAETLLIQRAKEEISGMREIWIERVIPKKRIRLLPQSARRAREGLERLFRRLEERSVGGLAVPRTAGPWRSWETAVAAELMSLGVPNARVVHLFRRADADPEDERTRINKNVREALKANSAPTNAAASAARLRRKER